MFISEHYWIFVYLIIIEILLITFFALIRYPIMDEKNYEIGPVYSGSSRWALCFYQSALVQTNVDVAIVPKSGWAKTIIIVQSFLAYVVMLTGIIAVFI